MKTFCGFLALLPLFAQLGCAPSIRATVNNSSSTSTSGKSAAEISAAINAKYEGVYTDGVR